METDGRAVFAGQTPTSVPDCRRTSADVRACDAYILPTSADAAGHAQRVSAHILPTEDFHSRAPLPPVAETPTRHQHDGWSRLPVRQVR